MQQGGRADSIQYSDYLGQAELQSGRQSRARGGRADGQAERTADAEQSTRRQSGRPSGDAGRLRGRGGRPVDTSRVAAQRRSRSIHRLLSSSPLARSNDVQAAPRQGRTAKRRCRPAPRQGRPAGGHEQSSSPAEVEVLSENWVVYHYFNLRAHRFEMAVIEIYDQSRADNKDVMKLVLGKHNLSAPITSYARPEVAVKSQSFFFTHSVKAMAVTQTAKGITSKQLLIGTIGDQVLALDKRYLDPRRSVNPTQQEKEEGIIPLTDSLPIIPQSFVTHSHQVEALRGIVSIPAKLESTTLLFTYGVDLFYTQLAPSRTYDSLTDEFSYALLLITIAVLVGAIIVTWIWSEKKELRDKWR